MAESQLTELQNMRVLLLEVFALQKPALQGPLYRTKIHNLPVIGYLFAADCLFADNEGAAELSLTTKEGPSEESPSALLSNRDHPSSRRDSGSSIISFMRTRKLTASAPSMTRWS
jgi:hypothetical protein